MKSLLLDTEVWDVVLDANGSIALAGDPYSVSQNVATAQRTFAGECLYDTTLGLPYWQSITGKMPPLSFVKASLEDAAKSVSGVADASAVFVSFDNSRNLTGQTQIITDAGIAQTVAI